MKNRQALGYMLLACKELGFNREQADKLYDAMYEAFDEHTEEEAEQQGHEWFSRLEDTK
ncbi:hypothetical protein [Sporosarcina aquimarina]|uniref:hypothetical protein n=1 Tax=Sporosarcina aquimarina TaxID=114975 RepID=UPI001C8E52C2|nr:hypothetical protein [Sporosarcina aquimarina]MBY0224117.1 hypothetical protein [Sporosarcina aquimarina]